MALAPGTRVGPYEIQRAVGAGGMGEVYAARDTRLDRTVAIKILPDALAADAQFRARFDREARAVAQLDHPHICALYDVGEHGGTAYLVMPYLAGDTLADRLARGALPLDEALRHAVQIADALDAAHRTGIVHRDLKPANVKLTPQGAVLLDFGLAKTRAPLVAGPAATMPVSAAPTTAPTAAPTVPALTAQGTILGTLQYMAPEQLEGREADARTDVFAFGALLYEMVTGAKAFEGRSQASLIGAILKDTPRPISALQPLAPSALDQVAQTCLEKRPEDRWPSMRDLRRELAWIAGPLQSPTLPPRVAAAAHPSWRAWTIAAALALLGIGLGAGLFLAPGPSARDAGDPAAGDGSDRSIAVLPFLDHSPGGDQEWFSDGLTEEILNALARVPDLRVASRASAFRFRASAGDTRTIAASLGVAHILHGSVRRDGDRLRVTAQLVRAADDVPLWSQSFDRDAAGVIGVQEAIAFEIARTMRVALEPEALQRLVAAGTNSVAAHEAFLRGWHLWRQQSRDPARGNPYEQALAAFEEARTLDPQFSDAHRLAADLWLEQLLPTLAAYGLTDLPYRERERRAIERARAAAATAPDEFRRLRAEAVLAQLEVRLRDAFDLMRQAARLRPHDWEPSWYAATLAVWIGEPEAETLLARATEAAGSDPEALDLITNWTLDLEPAASRAERGIALDPLNPNIVHRLHRVRLLQGRLDEAAVLLDRFRTLDDRRGLYALLAIGQACAEGRTADAGAVFEEARHAMSEGQRWNALTQLGRQDEATALLRPHDEARELVALLSYLKWPGFDPRAFPNLHAALLRQGISREPEPVAYACGARP